MMPEMVSISPCSASDITAMELEISPIATLKIARSKFTRIAIAPALRTVFWCVVSFAITFNFSMDLV